MINRIAIIGAGPAGCALACFLIERGIECCVFNSDKEASLIVGESLIPAAIPILRRLGIEEQVAEISHIKRGAALRSARKGDSARVDFEFSNIGNNTPEYAYNIPRPQFDKIVRARAEDLGANFVNKRAKVEIAPANSNNDIQLSNDSLSAAGLNRISQPDCLIDATGRSRLISRTLNIHATKGPRNDQAHFAHFENFNSDSNLEGQVVLSALEHGWSWQIPLPNSTSVGVVINKDIAKKYGNTPEEKLNHAISINPTLKKASANSKRISEVMTYSNYQLVSDRGYGKGWILLGDALGFVDPMLSPGVFMALESARSLDDFLFSKNYEKQDLNSRLDKYYAQAVQWHKSWSDLIQYFYDGRILKMGVMRDHIRSKNNLFSISKVAEPVVSRALARLVSGVSTNSKVDHAVLEQTCKYLINNDKHIHEYKIRST